MYTLYTVRVQSGKFINYCYLGVDVQTKAAFVIDPAWSIDEIMTITKRKGAHIESILITHSHFDHINKAAELSAVTNSKIFIGEKEYEFYRPDLPKYYLLAHEQQISFGNNIIKAYLTPGHTKGSMCYKIGNNFFTGDTLFIEGCGICSAEGGDPKEMYKSLNFLKKIISSDNYIYPGHAFLAPVGQKAICVSDNIYMNINNLDDFIFMRMRENPETIHSFI